MIADKRQPKQRVFWDRSGWNSDILQCYQTGSLVACQHELQRAEYAGEEGRIIRVTYERVEETKGPGKGETYVLIHSLIYEDGTND